MPKRLLLSKYSYNIYIFLKKKKKTKLFKKKKMKKKNNKCKINPCGWPKLQIVHWKIKNNSKVFKVGKK
jgi:hypothetical protein